MKRIIACLLAVFFIFSAMPITVQASQENTWDPDNGIYDISTEEDLLAFRDALNQAKQNNDYHFEGVSVNLLQDIEMTQTYVSPDSNGSSEAQFCGTFNGNNHTISNINMVTGDNYTVALLPFLGNATIKDLTLKDVKIENGYTWNSPFAPISLGDDKIINCHLEGNCIIQAGSDFSKNWNYNAGIVADNYMGSLMVENCTIDENVIINGRGDSEKYRIAGGICACARDATQTQITGCINNATITSDYIGAGIMGSAMSNKRSVDYMNYVYITDCYNYGNISSNDNTTNISNVFAGILAESSDYSDVVINRCGNYGNITVTTKSAQGSGGVAGELISASIINCFNAGNVYTYDSCCTGGVVGHIRTNTYGSPITTPNGNIYFPEQFNSVINCYNTGNVTNEDISYSSGDDVGGIIGILQEHETQQGHSSINNVYNFGNISSVGNGADIVQDVRCETNNAYYRQGAIPFEKTIEDDGTPAQFTCKNIGYYTSADENGKVYTGTITGNMNQTISDTPLDTDLRGTLNKYVDETNATIEADSDFKLLTWTYSDGSDGLGIHPIFGYNVINETPEADKEANGGYVSASAKGVAYEKINDSESNVVTITVVPNDGKELTNISVKDESGIPVNLTSLGSGVYSFTMPQCDVTVSATFTDSEDAPYNAYYLTVENNVDVNFLIDTEYYDAEDGYLEYEYISTIERESAERTSEPTVVSVESLTKYHGDNDYDGDRQLVLQAAPAQIGEKYIIRVYNRDGEFKAQFVRSIEDYCLAIKDRDDNFGYLARTILNYGQLANEYFEYAQKHELVNGVPYSIETVGDYTAQFTDDELNSLKESAGTPTINQGDKIQVTGVTYIAQLDPEFRFYIDGVTEEEAKELNVSVSGGLTATVAKVDNADEENNICVRVTGLSSNDFGYNFSLTIGDASLTYNGYDYVYMATQYGSNEKLKAMMRGVYRYARASEAAFGDETHIHPKNH